MGKRHRRELSKQVLLTHASLRFLNSTIAVNSSATGALRAVERSGEVASATSPRSGTARRAGGQFRRVVFLRSFWAQDFFQAPFQLVLERKGIQIGMTLL